MKILFIRANEEHPNSMHINNITALMGNSDITFYGPGYSSKEELRNGVLSFWKKQGGFDAIIIDFFITILQVRYLDIALAYHWQRYFLSDFNIQTAIQYADKIVDEVSNIDTVKIVQYMFDTVRFPDSWKDCLQELIDRHFYLWGMGAEFVPEFEQNKQLSGRGYSNNYRYFALDNYDHIISIPYQTVNLSEFYLRPLCERDYDITVPGSIDGIAYPDRRKIIEAIGKINFRQYDEYGNREVAYRNSYDKTNNSLFKRIEDVFLDEQLATNCIYVNSQLSRESRALWQEKYNLGLRRSKIAYADGGFSFQVMRKHAEICARGTVLICQEAEPLKAYGFINEINMIFITEKDVTEKCMKILDDDAYAQKIASNGQSMILKKHTSEAHSKMLLRAIEQIKKGAFKKSYWEKGEFIIEAK